MNPAQPARRRRKRRRCGDSSNHIQVTQPSGARVRRSKKRSLALVLIGLVAAAAAADKRKKDSPALPALPSASASQARLPSPVTSVSFSPGRSLPSAPCHFPLCLSLSLSLSLSSFVDVTAAEAQSELHTYYCTIITPYCATNTSPRSVSPFMLHLP